MAQALLEIHDLKKSFRGRERPVLRGVDLRVDPGEIVAILGPSGCGKTTLLRLIAGLERADAGTIHLAGEALSGPSIHIAPERRRIGLVFQEAALFPNLSVLENVLFGLDRLPSERRPAHAREVLRWVGLEDCQDRQPEDLSGGEQQRLAIARSLAPNPRAILLDEPFNQLDAGLRNRLRGELGGLLRREGMTAMLVTHDPQEALRISDRVGVLHDGKIVRFGSPLELYERPRLAVVARALGDANILEGLGHGKQARTVLGDVPLDRATEGRVALCLRPHSLALARPGLPQSRTGRLQRVEPLGDRRISTVRIEGCDITVQETGPSEFAVGDTVAVRLLRPATVLSG